MRWAEIAYFSQPIPSSSPSKPWGSGGNTVNRLYGTSLQSKSGGGSGIHTSGYAAEQLLAGAAVAVGSGIAVPVDIGVGTGVSVAGNNVAVGSGTIVLVDIGVSVASRVGVADGKGVLVAVPVGSIKIVGDTTSDSSGDGINVKNAQHAAKTVMPAATTIPTMANFDGFFI